MSPISTILFKVPFSTASPYAYTGASVTTKSHNVTPKYPCVGVSKQHCLLYPLKSRLNSQQARTRATICDSDHQEFKDFETLTATTATARWQQLQCLGEEKKIVNSEKICFIASHMHI